MSDQTPIEREESPVDMLKELADKVLSLLSKEPGIEVAGAVIIEDQEVCFGIYCRGIPITGMLRLTP